MKTSSPGRKIRTSPNCRQEVWPCKLANEKWGKSTGNQPAISTTDDPEHSTQYTVSVDHRRKVPLMAPHQSVSPGESANIQEKG